MRGQTTLDFAVGVSIFLVVVAFVVGFVPTMLEPFDGGTQEETAASDRLADQLVTDLLVADADTPYVLDRGCVVAFFALENSDGDPADDEDAYRDNDDVVRSDLYDVTGSDIDTGACNFDVDDGVFERMAVADAGYDVRVTLRGQADADADGGILCVDANEDGVNTVPDRDDPIIDTDDPYDSGTRCDMTGDDHDVAFVTGDAPPTGTGSVVTARRVVSIEGGFENGASDATLVVEVW
ncbi:hypothetical protein N0B31_02585 [Salinirubellus salinus]|uniref:Pilin/flagellin n=1 Tax=Salinirubellus salinus TaxID=1364945 RepID=A0A9E7R445_9EURY|nr:hypothetical protein [Salinirubellus salinus]UWM55177.1 hypothetical protein N0B31_02585 [Salinirubellus salinus]